MGCTSSAPTAVLSDVGVSAEKQKVFASSVAPLLKAVPKAEMGRCVSTPSTVGTTSTDSTFAVAGTKHAHQSRPPQTITTGSQQQANAAPTFEVSAELLKRRMEWTVKPGYSSGASSYGSSEFDDTEEDSFGATLAATNEVDGITPEAAFLAHPKKPPLHSQSLSALTQMDKSQHKHDLLGLCSLRQQNIADGDLAKTMVRIEVCKCLPV
jgi:hypothetical protein